MAVTPLRSLRVSDLTWEAWGAAASAAGVSVTKFVHVAMERELAAARGDSAGVDCPLHGHQPGVLCRHCADLARLSPPERDDAAASAIPRGRSVAKPDWKGGKAP